MILAHQIALDPTEKQKELLVRFCGVSRYVWNWALEQAEKHYRETGKTVDFLELKKRWNREKPDWAKEAPRDANSQPFADLQAAFRNFFKGIKEGLRVGKPRFKKKGLNDKFYVANDKFRLNGRKARLPRVGWVRMRESLRFEGKILAGTVRREANRWFLSIQVDVGDEYRRKHCGTRNKVTGIDLGLRNSVVSSENQRFEAPKPLKGYLRKLARANRVLSRRKKGSNRRERARQRVSRIHARISSIRKDWIHKLTTQLLRENQTIVIESLSVKNMMRHSRLARAFGDSALSEFRRQLEYKAPIFDAEVVLADQWFPSSKLCSGCGTKKKNLTLKDRIFHCESCGLKIDRDLNAAVNLRTLGLRGTDARGQEGSGLGFLGLGETGLDEPRTYLGEHVHTCSQIR